MILSISLILFSLLPQSFSQEDDQVVILHTVLGDIVIELFPNDAPKHVDNFINLTSSGFYDNTLFHRVIKDFMIQGGDPLTKPGAYIQVEQWGTGGPDYSIPAEFNDIKHVKGILSMARGTDPNSAGSQFFIVTNSSGAAHLDGQYTVFGRIITQESFDTLDKIANLDTPASLHNPDATSHIGTIPIHFDQAEIKTTEVVMRSEISNILDLEEPERVDIEPYQEPENKYSNDQLGFSFVAPDGWQIQELEKIHEDVPDVVAVAQAVGGFNPAISVTVENNNGISIDDYITNTKNNLQDSINSGQLEILSEEKSVIGDNDVYIMDVRGTFITPENTLNLLFKEITFYYSDRIYKITYTNTEEYFTAYLPQFSVMLDSLRFSSDVANVSQNDNEGGGCLIATAAYGTELASQIQSLRELRDSTLVTTESGILFLSTFNNLYYSFSPTIADWERENLVFKEITKITITPLITTLSILNHLEIDSEIEMVGYGLSVIFLNIGIYFAIPAMIIHRLIRK